MIDRELGDAARYAAATEHVAEIALAAARDASRTRASVRVNVADEPAEQRFYLTVTGSSAECGDDGQTGRGNRVNGLITPGRPMTMESVAGKNPVTHVGKLYNVAASLIAERIVDELDGVLGAECRLVSRIGAPVDAPQTIDLRLAAAAPEVAADWRSAAERIAHEELDGLPERARQLVRGELALDRWPLRV